MAESISIPLIHIQSMLEEIAPSWFHSRLQKLESMLIQIQQSVDYRLLQDLSIDEYEKLEKMTNDIRQFAYQIDDQLDTIYMNIESCTRWIYSNIPNVIKVLGITYHKSKFLHNIRLLINLVQKNKFVESQNFDIKEWNEDRSWNELYILNPHFYHNPDNFFYDCEGRIFERTSNFQHLIATLINKNNHETIIKINLSWDYVHVKEIYDNISIQQYFQSIAWISLTKNSKRIIVYREILKQLLTNDKKNDVVGLISMTEDEVWKELMELLTSNIYLVVLSFDRLIYDKNLVNQFNIPMRRRFLIIIHEEDIDCKDTLISGLKLLNSIIFEHHEEG